MAKNKGNKEEPPVNSVPNDKGGWRQAWRNDSRDAQEPVYTPRKCPECHGSKVIGDEECQYCSGNGSV